MRHVGAAALVSLVICVVPAATHAELAPGQKVLAETLIKQFSAREFAVRQAAVQALIVLGPDVLPLVREALAGTQDPEVKLRCEMVLKGIRERFGVGADGTKIKTVHLDASRVTIDLVEASLGEVLDILAEQSGNASPRADAVKDRPVTLKVKDMPYWQALDTLCRSAGVAYTPNWGLPPLRLYVPKVAPEYVGAYSGPVTVKVETCTRSDYRQNTRQLFTERNAQGPKLVIQRFVTFQMRCYIEDRLPVCRGHVRYIAARTPDGVDHAPEYARRQGAGLRAGGSRYSPAFSLSIKDTPDGIKGPVTIEGVVTLDFEIGKRELRVEDVFGGERPSVTDGLMTLTLLGAHMEPGGRANVSLKLAATGPDATVPPLVGAEHKVVLVDPRGRRYSQTAGRSSETSAKEVRKTVNFRNLPQLPGAWALVVTHAESVEKKDYPFKIKDIPLP